MPSKLPAFDPDTLKSWLIRHLEPICDADPPVLADYILALLKHDVAVDDMRKLCVSQLEDFLDRYTKTFVDDLIRHLEPGSGSSTSTSTASVKPEPTSPAVSSAAAAAPPPSGPSFSSASAKRTAADASFSDRSPKQARRSSLGGLDGRGNGISRGRALQERDTEMRDAKGSNRSTTGGGGRNAQAQVGPGKVNGSVGGAKGAAEPCRDYHFRGFCPLGSNCPYTHDLPPGVPPPSGVLSGPPTGSSAGPATGPGPNGAPFPPFFPAAMGMSMPFSPGAGPFAFGPAGGAPGFRTGTGFSPQQPQGTGGPNGMQNGRGPRPPRPHQQQQQQTRRQSGGMISGGGGGGTGGGGGGNPAPASRSSTRLILVDNIPPTSLSEPSVRHFFTPFGTILSLALNPEARKAEILYDHPKAADKAVRSEQAVFANRFVRVYRLDEGRSELLREEVEGAGPVPVVQPRLNGNGNGNGNAMDEDEVEGDGTTPAVAAPSQPSHSAPHSASYRRQTSYQSRPSAPAPPPPNPAIKVAFRLSQISSKQKELLEQIDAADAQRRKAIMTALRALGKEADELKRQVEEVERRKSSSVASTAGGGGGENEDAGVEVSGTATGMEMGQEEDPREKLRKLREEAASLGLDPSSGAPARKYALRPYQSAPTARRPPGSFKLDNRSTSVILSGFDETLESEEVQKYFSTYGSVAIEGQDVEKQELTVKFDNRKDAERALAAGTLIPSLSRSFPMRWSGTAPPPPPSFAPAPVSSGAVKVNGDGEDVSMAEGREGGGGRQEVYEPKREERDDE